MNKIPESVIPTLNKVIASKLTPNNLSLEVWRYDNHYDWVNIFTELGIELFNSQLNLSALPPGYSLVAYIFDFEAQLSFDGWLALDNRSDFINEICNSYALIGLPKEAAAIKNAYEIWDSTINNYNETSDAYFAQSPEFQNELDRLEHMVCYFIDNANDLFYENA